MLVVAQVTFQHENDEGQQWGRQLLILVVDRPNPIFCTSFSKHIWPYWKQLYKIYYVMLAWKNNLGHQHFFKSWIIKKIVMAFWSDGGLAKHIPFLNINWCYQLKQKCACLLYRIPFLDFVILLMMYSWSVVDTGFMNLNCFQFHPFLDMEILRMVYTYFSGWALFSSPKGSLIASFTFVPEPLITTPKLDF